jgi:magnesium transporter
METTTRLLLPEVMIALDRDPAELRELIDELHPADLADLAAALGREPAQRLLALLEVDTATRLLEACDEELRVELFGTLAESDMGSAVAIIDEMAADDRADLVSELPDELRTELLDAIEPAESRDIRQLLAYQEDSAGALLTTDYVALPASATAAAAIDLIRTTAADMETIYQCYAVDPHGTLLGVVSLRDLVTAPADRTIDEIMKPHIVTIAVDDDQEDAARTMAKYDLLALPVVDRSHRILGIITVDDVMDVVVEEATEDAHKLGAVEPLEAPYLSTPVWQLVRARAPWLIVLFIAMLATGSVIEHYSATMAIMLLWFVPLITSAGGNSGSQSATLIIRAMAVERLSNRDGLRVLGREILVGVSLGLIVGVVGVVRVLVTSSTRNFEMAVTIGASVTAVVTVGALLGSGVPLLLRRLGLDPAVSSTPFIASVLDVFGLIIYFEIAKLVM